MSLLGYTEETNLQGDPSGVWTSPWQKGMCDHGCRYDYRFVIYGEPGVRPEGDEGRQEERAGFDCEQCLDEMEDAASAEADALAGEAEAESEARAKAEAEEAADAQAEWEAQQGGPEE